ncbi:MAG: glucosamine-6-phosphate deaminase [Phycisphaeraceae bacterium]|nr:glucosamine-6-phosphate deaminase [Phycisphaeraceae bacterium]
MQSLYVESIPSHATPQHPERLPVAVFQTSAGVNRAVAGEIASLIRSRAGSGRPAVLGLATGSTPVGVYDELVRLHKEEGLSFKNVITFNLDEYWPMKRDELQSYHRFMREHLFDHIDIPSGNWNLPDGEKALADVERFCQDYEKKIADAGGIDIQLLGIGRTGHIGFNEPGSARDSRTRLIWLDHVTRMDASSDFFGEWNVPRRAVTMGVGTILDARRVLLLAFGEHKAKIVKRAVEGDISQSVSASFLQQHPSAQFVLDPAAAADLTRFRAPWLLGPIERYGLTWDERMTRKATIWLARELKKPILKLTNEDYNEHGLQELLANRVGSMPGASPTPAASQRATSGGASAGMSGGAYAINLDVFRSLQKTITGWPGGKPNQRAGEGPGDFPKRVIVFSPHPDDDVISMGGTFIRLCEQGHEVHVAYQTSGNIAVWDESALRHADFVSEFARAFPQLGTDVAERIEQSVETFIRSKQPGAIDTPELQKIKGLIRRTEARAGARYSGVREENIHFLDLPFYETGRVKKMPIGEDDLRITMELLRRVKPQQVYAAGDLSDPHGTHRVCLDAILKSIERLRADPKEAAWARDCVVWLYRGAWQEWEPEEIEMAVPLSPDEVVRKRMAIFKHESQKDRALFPGPSDPREFWQRAEDRNRATAKLYDMLGLAEYEAIEGFVRWKG